MLLYISVILIILAVVLIILIIGSNKRKRNKLKPSYDGDTYTYGTKAYSSHHSFPDQIPGTRKITKETPRTDSDGYIPSLHPLYIDTDEIHLSSSSHNSDSDFSGFGGGDFGGGGGGGSYDSGSDSSSDSGGSDGGGSDGGGGSD